MHKIINELYEEVKLPLHDNTVYKVEEIKNLIPPSKLISKADRKTIVVGVLDVMKLNVSSIHEDAQTRIKAITEADVKARAEGADKAQNLKQTIAGLEAQIKEYRNELATVQIECRDKALALDAETIKINELVNFIS